MTKFLSKTVSHNAWPKRPTSGQLNNTAPNFKAETTEGQINFHDWIGESWCISFSHPKDFIPVCSTELGYMAGLKNEFEKRNCKIIGLSIDPVSDHVCWAQDIGDVSGNKLNSPVVDDKNLEVSKLYDMLLGDSGTSSEGRTSIVVT